MCTELFQRFCVIQLVKKVVLLAAGPPKSAPVGVHRDQENRPIAFIEVWTQLLDQLSTNQNVGYLMKEESFAIIDS